MGSVAGLLVFLTLLLIGISLPLVFVTGFCIISAVIGGSLGFWSGRIDKVNEQIKRNIMISHDTKKLATVINQLSSANPSLDTPENINLLTTHAAYADKLAEGLKQLNRANPRLDTEENIGILIQYRDFIDRFLLVDILNQEHFKQIKNSIDDEINKIKEQRLAFLTSIYKRRSPDSEIYQDESKPEVIRFFQPRLEPTKDLAKKIFDYLPKIHSLT